MSKTFVLHDESVNSHGYWMMTDGCDLSQFEKNPIMLWEHNRAWGDTREAKLPIGHWENVRKKGKQILADAVFDEDEFSQTIAKKVENNTLRMASVGAISIESSTDAKYIKQGQRYETILKWVLKEASIVNIGANNNALSLSAVLYDEADNVLELSDASNSPLKELSTKTKSMNKKLLTVLELSADATEQDVTAKVEAIVASNVQLTRDKETLTTEKGTLQDKLDAIELADNEAKKAKFSEELKLAAKDGRVDFDAEGKTEQRWMKLFDTNAEDTMATLTELPKKESGTVKLSDSEGGSESAWARRQKEISANKDTREGNR